MGVSIGRAANRGERAGVASWPKPFQNLRASRENELAHTFPLHVVTEWLGNTPQVALKHYLRVTDEDFAQACGEGAAKSGAPDTANQVVDADLNEVTSAWPLLSADLRHAILAIVRAGRSGGRGVHRCARSRIAPQFLRPPLLPLRQHLYWWNLDTLTAGAAHETSAGFAAGYGDRRVWGASGL